MTATNRIETATDMRGRLAIETGAAATYIVGGHAVFTVRSAKTGVRYTYQVTHKPAGNGFPENYLVALLTGPDNQASFTYLGKLDPAKLELVFTRASKLARDAKPVEALDFALKRAYLGKAHPALEIWHEGACCRCGRRLTVPESIESGIGPVCAAKGRNRAAA